MNKDKKRRKNRKILLNNILIVLIISNFVILSSENTDETIYSYVTMKLTKGNDLKVYGEDLEECDFPFTKPDEVYINGDKKSNLAEQDFPEEENEVILKWKNPITSCACMFRDCGHIIEIDFSHFDASQVTYVLNMFRDCKMLKSLNLSNFDTSKIKGNNGNMFWGCSSLEYLDISNFDTSQNEGFGHFFYDCKSLKSLDLSKLDTSNALYLDYMFYGCEKLTSLNLSNFKTSKAINMSNMFQDCISLRYLNVDNFDTSAVTDMSLTFYNCTSLLNLNLYSFNTSQVQSMSHLFHYCSNLTSINISSNFKTTKIKDMSSFFSECENLEYLDLSYFDTNKVENFGHMFYNCKSLISLNFSNFITSNVVYMDYMFYNCNNLISLDLSKFNTNKVNNFTNIFNGCKSLTSLDISNFDTTKITQKNKLYDMFSNCEKLEFINLKNYKDGTHYLKKNSFQGTSKNVVICTLNERLKQEINNDECIKNNCEKNWYEYKSKLYENDRCIDNCTLILYQYEYNYKCISSCLIGTYNNNYKCENCHPDCKECEEANTTMNTNCITCIDENKYLYFGNCLEKCPREDSYYYNESLNQTICKCELPQCYTCTKESLEKNLCIKCDKGYYPIYDELYTKNLPLLNCSKSPQGFYLDISEQDNHVYKLCYETCKKCNISGNDTRHNCIECKDDYMNETIFDIYKNCYKSCPNDYDKLIENKSECVSDCIQDDIFQFEFRKKCYSECPLDSIKREEETNINLLNLNFKYFCKPKCSKETPYEMIYTQECVKNCDIKSFQEKTCIINYIDQEKESEETNEKENEIKAHDMILENLEIGFTQSDFNTSDLENGKNDVVEC